MVPAIGTSNAHPSGPGTRSVPCVFIGPPLPQKQDEVCDYSFRGQGVPVSLGRRDGPMRMRVQLGVAVVALALITTGCLRGSSPEEDREGEMVWAIAGSDMTPHEQVRDLWNEQHPDTQVRIERLPDDADNQRVQMGLELNAEGTAFDILALDIIWTGEFAEYGWIESLEEFRGEAEEQLLGGPLATGTFEDELWAMPYNSSAGILFYRSDLIDEPPKTWEEAVEMGSQAAEEAGIYPFVGQGAAYEGLVVNYLEYLWGDGGDVLGEDGTEVLYGQDDAAVNAVEFMHEAQDNGFYAPGFNTMMEDQAKTEFAAGNAVFMRNWPPFYDFLQEPENSQVVDNFDIAPLPVFEEGTNPAVLGGYNLAVSAYSEHKDAAKEFVRFAALDPDVQRGLAEGALAPVLESTYEELQDDPVMSLMGDAHTRPPVPAWNDISLVFQQQVFPAYTGQQPAEAAVRNVESELTEITERRQRRVE